LLKQTRLSSFLLLILLFAGCSNTRYLKSDESLYTGAKVIVRSDLPAKKRSLKNELEKIAYPKPNTAFLGIRYKLWFYNLGNNGKPTRIRRWIKAKAMQAPVLASQVHPDKTATVLRSRLYSRGYLHAQVSSIVTLRKGKTSVTYTADLGTPFFLGKVRFPSGSDTLSLRVRKTEKESLLKEGMQYDLGVLKNERIRIDGILKDSGFYYFNPDYLLFKADTSNLNRKVNLSLAIKQDIPDKAAEAYHIGKIFFSIRSKLLSDSLTHTSDTVLVSGCYYQDKDSTFRPEPILNSVFLKSGNLYSQKDHRLTISRLVGMGVFSYVGIKFKEPDSQKAGILDVYIDLTPMPGKSVTAELEAVTKSDNYTGPELTVSYKNRNLWRGAELLAVNANGSFETQLTGGSKKYSSYEVGSSVQLFIPHFMTPFPIKHVSGLYVPKTKVDLGISLLQRVNYFSMDVIHTSFGYQWRESLQKDHSLDLFSVNFAKLLSTTPAFNTLLIENPFLKKSFQEQFIIGSDYTFTYNSQLGAPHANQFYFSANLNPAGNAIFGIQSLMSSRSATDANPYLIGGYPYAQYTRITTDTRYFHTFNSKHKIATRLIVAAGIPYGNSNTMPYIKQFFSGGPNSLRAFPARSVGPGSYVIPANQAGSTFLDQSGDIKLEGNLEYRFQIIGLLKGAAFLDAGNVWLAKKNPEIPGGEFNIDTFESQLAVGTGIGLRADLSFFILRFDLGIPLRRPNLPESDRWVGNRINFEDPNWRSNNLVLNIAIGYPF